MVLIPEYQVPSLIQNKGSDGGDKARAENYEISLQYNQVEVNKTWSEWPLELFKPETVSSRDDDSPSGALS